MRKDKRWKPQYQCKKLGIAVRACNPTVVGLRRLRVHWPASLDKIASFQFLPQQTLPKDSKVQSERERHLMPCFDLSMHTHGVCTYPTHVYAQTQKGGGARRVALGRKRQVSVSFRST